MRSILYALLLVIFTSCHSRMDDMFKPLNQITIQGTVVDADNNKLDSVEVKLYGSTLMYEYMPKGGVYSENGIFKIEFKPEAMWSYRLEFKKGGYTGELYGINMKEAHQTCNTIMEKVALK